MEDGGQNASEGRNADDRASLLTSYTFLCIRDDGSVYTIDLRDFANDLHVRDHAESLRLEHGSCNTVEVWEGERWVFTARAT